MKLEFRVFYRGAHVIMDDWHHAWTWSRTHGGEPQYRTGLTRPWIPVTEPAQEPPR